MRKLLLLAVLFIFVACDDDQKGNDSLQYTVRELITSQECKSNCGESSACESRDITVTGILRQPNTSIPWIHLEEKKDRETYSIELRLESSAGAGLLQHLDSLYNVDVKVKSNLQGEDRAINFDCLHLFFLELSEADQIALQ